MNLKLLNRYLLYAAVSMLPCFTQAQADLTSVQTVSSSVSPGRNLTYTILVANFGPAPATSVNLIENLAPGVTFVSFTAPAGWNVIAPIVGANAPVIATIPSLPSGSILTFTLVVNVPASAVIGTVLSNTANLNSATPDPDPTNNQSSGVLVVSLVPTFDVGINNRPSVTVNTGGRAIFLVQVSNPAMGLQLGVSFADILPPGTSLVSLTAPAGWTTTTPAVGSNGIITATIPLFASGSEGVFIIVLNVAPNVPSGTTLVNFASVTSFTPDLNPNNNSTGAGVRVLSLAPADLSVTNIGPLTVSPGAAVSYLITVRNNGPNMAENVSLTSGLQSGLTFLSLSAPAGWTVSTPQPGVVGQITATIPLLADGALATFTLNARTPDNLSGPVSNTAQVLGGNTDPNASNNFSTTTAAISGNPSCTISCPSNMIVNALPGQCGAVVNFPFPSLNGVCGTVTAVPASGSLFPVGTTTVRINSSTGSTCSFTIRVNETQPPVISSCPAIASLCSNSTGMYTIPRLVASDNCGPAIISYTINGATVRNGNGDNASGAYNTGTSTINWTVRDSSNNIATCQTNVVINNPLAATIPDAVALGTGVNINTVYPGYAPASKLILSAKASGGRPPYAYSWSNGATTASITVSPAVSTNYTVVVSDASGCKQESIAKLVKAVDVRCGAKGNNVQVCIVPPGNFGLSYNSCIEAYAVGPLLEAGAHLGNCSTMQDFTLGLKAIPNPANAFFTIEVTSNNIIDKITLNIYSITGKLVESRTVNANSKVQIGAYYSSGTYLAEAVQGAKKTTLLLIRL